MEWLSHLRRSGCGASVFLKHPLANIYVLTTVFSDYVVSKTTPTIHTRLGYKMFFMFASLNIGAMAPFALYGRPPCLYRTLQLSFGSMIPETKGRSLEEMDIVFGAVSAHNRAANIARHEHGACFSFCVPPVICSYRRMTEISNTGVHADLERANSIDDKGGAI